ncbi:MAG: chemotaxis protein CheW [Actinobacteria bacterium]|nr:chemotaxis protein CheW [Actinomycetota bacterium]
MTSAAGSGVAGSSEEILRQRARELAEPARSEPADRIEVLAFEVSGQRFVVALGDVVQVVAGSPLARVPHAPSALLGVATLRGSLLTVFDLAPHGADRVTPAWMLVFGDGADRLAIAADHVTGTRRLDRQELLDADASQLHAAPVARVTRDGAGLLDVDLLLTWDRFTPAPQPSPGSGRDRS